jgi:hypothetical protein
MKRDEFLLTKGTGEVEMKTKGYIFSCTPGNHQFSF